MSGPDSELIAAARALVGEMKLGKGASAGSVGAAIRTMQGDVFTGICIDLECGLGFCAEVSAITQMLAHRQSQIDTVVAVTRDKILPPCGRCRETMAQIDPRNLDCKVIIGEGQTVPLRELLPHPWLSLRENSKSGD